MLSTITRLLQIVGKQGKKLVSLLKPPEPGQLGEMRNDAHLTVRTLGRDGTPGDIIDDIADSEAFIKG